MTELEKAERSNEIYTVPGKKIGKCFHVTWNMPCFADERDSGYLPAPKDSTFQEYWHKGEARQSIDLLGH